MSEKVLELNNLAVSFDTPEGEVEAVRGVDLSVDAGEIVCVVGESGCGKSAMCLAVMGLLPRYAYIKHGTITVCGTDITTFTESQMRKIRGGVMSMIFQDPLAALNPTLPVGKQIAEAILKNRKVSKAEATARALELMNMTGIADAAELFNLQPHFFSGGMRQRCVIAAALAAEPKILFADEATTALDVTVKAKMLDLISDIRTKTGIGVVFVTHDLGSVARIADRVAVMYAGKIVEIGTAEDIFYDPRHPYTWGLLSSLPDFGGKDGTLRYIPGMPPSLRNPPKGDAFAVRNEYALAIDYEQMPPMFTVSDTHRAATWLLDKRAPHIEPPASLRDKIKQRTKKS